MVSKKIVLTGCFGVGKTSLFNRFLYQRFSEKYLTTIGVKVDKKVVEVDGRQISLLIWDIAGEVAQDKVPQSYFLGSSAIIYVFDLVRPSTWLNMKTDIEYLEELTKGVLVRIVGNKVDLTAPNDLLELKTKLPMPWNILTSAKTGENVDALFTDIGAALLDV
ncbi:MAG: GTP-binding protein [Lewinellaceae bacterium]|nr:GTP-binding protein [Saprospiraceae bacterium]MCB9338517.1 GTP-binding protein [Lewinellaceae bacterium]